MFDNQQGNSLKEGKQESGVCYPNPITYSTYYAYWDGKIGIWPKGSYQPAVRGSVNWPAGTLLWHDEPVTKEVYRNLLTEKVVLAIIEKKDKVSLKSV